MAGGMAGRVAKKIGWFVRKKPLGAFGAVVLILLITFAAFANVISPYGPLDQNVGQPLSPPSAQHLAGTDQFGRDMFTRLVHGARISLTVSVLATVIATIPSTLLGIATAYYQGWFDLVFQRIVDAVQAVPGLILLITLVSILGSGLFQVILALALPNSITSSRVKRAAAIQISGKDYVLAARSLGATNLRVMLQYVLPNIMAPIIIVISLGFGGYILAESTLSFLGYGVPPPAPSWGGMLASDGRRYMYVAPHMFIGPAFALSVVVFGVNMFGDAMRDILDPRLRGSGK
jgi:peptide/nickel transport system permease protein